MHAPPWQEIVPSLAMAVALAACAGLRAWLPLFLAGLLARFELLHMNHAFGFLSSDRALILFGVATLIEIAADKIPALDHALDSISTVLRPAAGSLLAASVLGWIKDPLTAVALGVVVGAPSAFVPHVAKAGVRAVSSALTAGVANPLLSFLEDILAVLLFILAVVVPIVTLILMAIVLFFIFRRMRRARPAT